MSDPYAVLKIQGREYALSAKGEWSGDDPKIVSFLSVPRDGLTSVFPKAVRVYATTVNWLNKLNLPYEVTKKPEPIEMPEGTIM